MKKFRIRGAATLAGFRLENMYPFAVQFEHRLKGFEFVKHPVGV